MRLLDISFRRPEDNLAFDEVLLNGVEMGRAPETLRFWESPRPFVVVGCSQAVRQEVFERTCVDNKIPILRRCSAGGCVLQGPGCLNFAIVLSHEHCPEIQTIRGSYCYILGRIAEAFQRRGVLVHHKGVSDLALRGKKVSGNSQKRRRKAILHHGTLLYSLDPAQIELYIREPNERPQYRGPRTHRGFLNHLPLSPGELREIVIEAFNVSPHPVKPFPWEIRAMRALIEEKYASRDWTYRR